MSNFIEYIVKPGDNLWNLSKQYLEDGNQYQTILKTNGLTSTSIIPGQHLIVPKKVETDRVTVNNGESLSSIALKGGVTVDQLVKLNNISDPSKIFIGQQILVPKNTQYKPQLRTYQDIKKIETSINKNSNLDIINTYHRNKQDNQYYLVDDKQNNRLLVYINGNLVKSYKAIHGKNKKSDDMTITHTDRHGQIINLAGNLSTPAGVYFTTRGNDYHGAPSFIRRTEDMVRKGNPNGIPSSIHARTIREDANTNGCTGMSSQDLKDLAKYVNNNTRTYILPSNKNNRFFIRNGELQFHSSDITKTPAYNSVVSHPIKRIVYSTKGFNETNKQIVKAYNAAIINMKANLQKDLGINNDTYNELALKSLGILGVESNYGNENSAMGNFIRAARKAVFKNNSSPDYKSKFYTYKVNSDNNSIGLTQIRFSFLSDKEKQLFNKYGITKESLVNNPGKAAIATLIKLACNYKDAGNNVDKAIQRWNQKSSYLQQVNQNAARFSLYETY